jgi:hypothetical protein
MGSTTLSATKPRVPRSFHIHLLSLAAYERAPSLVAKSYLSQLVISEESANVTLACRDDKSEHKVQLTGLDRFGTNLILDLWWAGRRLIGARAELR